MIRKQLKMSTKKSYTFHHFFGFCEFCLVKKYQYNLYFLLLSSKSYTKFVNMYKIKILQRLDLIHSTDNMEFQSTQIFVKIEFLLNFITFRCLFWSIIAQKYFSKPSISLFFHWCDKKSPPAACKEKKVL